MATAEQMAEMVCLGSPLAVQAAIRLYRLTAAFPPSLSAYARHLDQEIAETEDGAEGVARVQGKAQAGVEVAVALHLLHPATKHRVVRPRDEIARPRTAGR